MNLLSSTVILSAGKRSAGVRKSAVAGVSILLPLFILIASPVARAASEVIDDAKLLKMLEAKLPEEIITMKLEEAAKEGVCRVTSISENLIKLQEAGGTPELLKLVMKISSASEDDARKAVDDLLRWAMNVGDANSENVAQARSKVLSYGQSAVPHLVKRGLNSGSPLKVAAAIDALGEIGDKAVFEDVWRRLSHPDDHVRVAAAKAVVRLGDDKTKERLVSELRAGRRYIDGVIYALGYLKDNSIEPVLIKILAEERDENNRSAAAFALGEMGAPSPMGLERLKYVLLNDMSNKVRVTAAAALSRVAADNNDVALALQRAFERHADSRIYLTAAMARFHHNSILIGFLITDVLGGEYPPSLKESARKSLQEMTGVKYGGIDEWRNWWRFAASRPPYVRRVNLPPMPMKTPKPSGESSKAPEQAHPTNPE